MARVRFDSRITVGNIITAVAIIGSVTAWAMTLDSRLAAETAARGAEVAGIQQELVLIRSDAMSWRAEQEVVNARLLSELGATPTGAR
ncbi:MAG: hypothetical protein ACREFX_07440 [Opitutaceae bacterium]